MISFNYQTFYGFRNKKKIKLWLLECIMHLQRTEGNLNYVFCNNKYILEMNKKYLNHDYTTDIITFDYSVENHLHAEFYVSLEQIKENAKQYKTKFDNELHRVLVHGILHLAGYNDKTNKEQMEMRAKEDYYLSLRTF